MVGQILIRVPVELKEIINNQAKKMGLTANAFILQILWDWVDGKEEEPMKNTVKKSLFTAAEKALDHYCLLRATVGEDALDTIVEREIFFALKGVIEQGGMLPLFERFIVRPERQKEQGNQLPPYMRYDKKIFANNLKFYMQRNGIKTEGLAMHLSVPPSIVSEWRRAKKLPRWDKVLEMAKYFEVDVEDLICDKM